MRRQSIATVATVAVCAAAAASVRSAEISFNRDIRPILAQKCLQCHGPDEEARQADLRLDRDDPEFGPHAERETGRAITPGDIEESELWHRITTDSDDERMPPPGSQKTSLTAAERELMRRWIAGGSKYEPFWAFVAPTSPSVPQVVGRSWLSGTIDRFVLTALEKEGHTPQTRADKRTLLRRVTLDLTGLPPARDEILQFTRDTAPDAYERLVDRLMSSPQYGEHMAKYWLDLVRFADTNGIHHDHYREMTPYRDWVVRAFNANLPFDDFATYQLAGDIFPEPTVDQQIASGFNRLHLVIDRGTALPEESFVRNVVDRVNAVGTAFMGLTLGCAVCHDHKYDPITQRDFYQLYAFFNNIDAGPETPGSGVHAPFIRLPTPEQEAAVATLQQRSAQLAVRIDALRKASQGGAVKESVDESNAALLKEAEAELQSLEKAKRQIEGQMQVSLVMKEREEVRPTHILVRGAYDQPGEEVFRNTPAFLPPLEAQAATKTRLDLANWLTSGAHPLTARVTVNRFWQQFFGVGLVKTSEDFGTQGEWPTHPQLLDELSVAFVQSGWDVKRLVRGIVLSETYRQTSSVPRAVFEADPENRLLARGSRFRMDAEMIRDQILAVSGRLDQTMYGKSVKPPQPPNLWKSVSMVSSSTYAFQADDGAKICRRSVYSFWKRALPPPQMTIFDAPTREACSARRERTNTPLQALVLMNESEFFKSAREFALRMRQQESLSDRQRLRRAYEAVTTHLPDSIELASLEEGLAAFRDGFVQDLPAAMALTADLSDLSDAARVELAAYTMVANALFNLDVTKTRE